MLSVKSNISNGVNKINILGVNITNIAPAEVLGKIQEFLNGRKQHFIVTPNPEIILHATQKDEELWYILNHADLALADGVALKLAGWFYGQNLKRITGADLSLDILKLAQEKKYKIAVFSWSGGLSSAQEIKSAINKEFPGIAVYVQDIERDCIDNNLIPLTPPPEADKFIKGVNDFAPEIIFCALGAPYQEKFIYNNLSKIPSAKLGLAVGGSFDFLTGKAKRAPKVLRNIGLEWLWRFIKQPKRAKRIFQATIIFPFRFLIFFFILRWFYRPNIACLLYKKEIQSPRIPLLPAQAGYQGGDKKKVKYKILTVERVGEPGHWQLPQGGTDGENLRMAGARELKEELNTDNFKPIAVFENIHKYKFSKILDKYGLPVKNQRGHKGQKQSLFIAEFTGADSEIKVNFWEHSAWRWVEAEKLVEAVHPLRREAAKVFMEKFWGAVKK